MIEAKCIKNKDPWSNTLYEKLEINKVYKVDYIDMGQSSTDIYLKGIKHSFNSVCFKFYENKRPINIYKDKRFNPYL